MTIKDNAIADKRTPTQTHIFALDPTKKPKVLDLQDSERDEVIVRAIYEIDGDTLKVAGAVGSGCVRPKQFTAPTLYASFLVTLNAFHGLMIITLPTDPYILTDVERSGLGFLSRGYYVVLTLKREAKK